MDGEERGGGWTRIFRSRVFWCIFLPLLMVSLLVGGDAIYRRVKQNAPTPAPSARLTPRASVSPAITPSPNPTPEPTPSVRHYPVRVYFPVPGTQSDIFAMGVVDGAIGTRDSAAESAWYNKSAVPGESGNCILSGHDRWEGETGVFAWLKKAKPGDEIHVETDDGKLHVYVVTQKEEQPYNEFSRYHMYTEGETRLTLITCKGDYDADAGTSLTRVVVVCTPSTQEEG